MNHSFSPPQLLSCQRYWKRCHFTVCPGLTLTYFFLFIMAGMHIAISGTSQRKASLNKHLVYTCVCMHAVRFPTLRTATSVANETSSVLTVSGELNAAYRVVLRHM